MRGAGRVSKPVLLSVLCVAMLFFVGTASARQTVVTILGTADLHGHIFPWDYALDAEDSDTGYAKVASVVKEVRADNPNTLLVDAGDTIQGNLAELFHGEEIHPVIQAMNRIGYDTWTLGNHDFNFGLDVLGGAIDGSQATVLVANIYQEDGTRWLTPYVIKEIAGVKIGLFGLITPHIPRWEASTPTHFTGLTFTDPIAEAKKVVADLKNKVDVIVLIAHLGLTPEYGLASSGLAAVLSANPEIAVAIAGHAHAEIAGAQVGEALVVEPGRYGNKVSRIDLTFEVQNGACKLVKKEAHNINTKNYPADPEVVSALQAYHDAARAEANTIIGRATADFLPQRYVLPGIPTAQVQDTALVDLINQIQLEYTGADISAAALFGAHSDLKAGMIRKRDVFNLYKYDNTLLAVKITGQQLKDYLEWSARYFNRAKPGDVTVSFNKNSRSYNYDLFAGVDYEIDISRSVGDRITNLKFKGEPVTAEQVFTLALNNFRFNHLVAEGIFRREDIVFDSYAEWGEAGRIRNLIVEYIQEKGSLTPRVDHNWRIIGVELDHPLKDEVYAQILAGQICLPRSAEGPNVKALNVYELMDSGQLPYRTLTILYTSDTHSHLEVGEDLVRLVAEVDQYRRVAPRTLVVGVGERAGKPMNPIRYDALTVGEHDYIGEPEELLEFDLLTESPVLCANLHKAGSPLLAPYLVKEVDGIYVGIFGFVTGEDFDGLSPQNVPDLAIIDPLVAARQMVAELAGKADVIIALSQPGSNGAPAITSRDLAEQVPGIDLIIAGDGSADSLLVGKTLIVPAGGDGRLFGVAELIFDNKEIISRYVKLMVNISGVERVGERKSQDIGEGKSFGIAKDYTIIANRFLDGSGAGFKSYKIQPGDTLSEIALRLDVSLTDLVKLNSVSNPDLIYADQILLVPVGSLGSNLGD